MRGREIYGERIIDLKAVIGQANKVQIRLENRFNETQNLHILDEIPYQVRDNNQELKTNLKPGELKVLQYSFTPLMRGQYEFQRVLIFVNGWFSLLQNRVKIERHHIVDVFPNQNLHPKDEINFIQRRSQIGERIIKTRGQSMEFDQITDYAVGDDQRFINWAATARSNQLKVSRYVEEKSQNIYFLLDKGRTMNYQHLGQHLIDYAINASVHLAKIALKQGDRAGTVVFSHRIHAILKAHKSNTTLKKLNTIWGLQSYKTEHSNFNQLYLACNQIIAQRSLLFLFTNFDTLKSVQDQMMVFRKLNKQHLLVVVFFEDKELSDYVLSAAENYDDAAGRTIARQYYLNQSLIKMELEKYKIKVIYCLPTQLGSEVRNMYLNIKKSNIL